MSRRKLLRSILCPVAAAATLCAGAAFAETGAPEQGRRVSASCAVLGERERVEPVNRMLRDRLDHLLPALMRETGIDLWLVINREYAEDPVYLTLVPEPVFAARRTTMLVFHDRGADRGDHGEAVSDHGEAVSDHGEAVSDHGEAVSDHGEAVSDHGEAVSDHGEAVSDHGEAVSDHGEAVSVERLTVSRYGAGDLYEPAWEGGDLDEQWGRLVEIVAERDPRRIGIDVSRHWPVADGLTASLRDRLLAALGPELGARVVSAEELVVRWIETRSAQELEAYPHIVALARGVIAEAFSEKVVTPGVTTTDDVAWFIRERFAELGLPIWFMPYVNAQRPGSPCERDSPFCGEAGVIHRGDVLHTDVGICYLRLCTDTQEMGYVLRLGERQAPPALASALAAGNRWQDLLTAEMTAGRSGNEILQAARRAAEARDIHASVYTHPIGFFGHAPGPTIGMWDNQGPTPERGDWPLHADTAYAIEGNVKVRLEAWDGQWVQIKLEQSAVFDGEQVHYLAGRQTEWHVVR